MGKAAMVLCAVGLLAAPGWGQGVSAALDAWLEGNGVTPAAPAEGAAGLDAVRGWAKTADAPRIPRPEPAEPMACAEGDAACAAARAAAAEAGAVMGLGTAAQAGVLPY